MKGKFGSGKHITNILKSKIKCIPKIKLKQNFNMIQESNIIPFVRVCWNIDISEDLECNNLLIIMQHYSKDQQLVWAAQTIHKSIFSASCDEEPSS